MPATNTGTTSSENAGWMPALTGFPHSWKEFLEWKSPWAGSLYLERSSLDTLWICTLSECFPEPRWTWGRCICGGPVSAVLAQRSLTKAGVELGWPLLKTRAAHKWLCMVLAVDPPQSTFLLLKVIPFSALEATCPLSKRSLCSSVRLCWGPLGSLTPGLWSSEVLAPCTVP